MSDLPKKIIQEVRKVICGKDYVIAMALAGILSGGHVLIEDVPGVGKTSMALAFSRTMGLDYGRVQFTPDVLPSDITGFSVFDKATSTMKYQPGSIFHNLFLADELNRATSRTQSALLEAMEEGHVTVDGTTYALPKPFTVFATQNPSDASGTSLLPDSQIDRFAIRITMGYPSMDDERNMVLNRKDGNNPLDSVRMICNADMLIRMQDEVNKIHLSNEVLTYILNLINKTRKHEELERGGSPRSTLALTSVAKASAYLQGRSYVTPKDVQFAFSPVIAHRLILTPEAEVNGRRAVDIVEEILKSVPVPRV